MSLWRLTYLRAKVPCACTFAAADLIAAMDFYELWERMNPSIKEVEMISLGHSRYGQARSAAGRTRAESKYFGNYQ